MSRSPSRNQSSPPKLAADSSAFHVSPERPQPRSSSISPAKRVDEAVEIGRDVKAEDLDVVADVADDGQLARLEQRSRDLARTARRRLRPTATRPSRRNGEERARPRTEALREALEIRIGVDVDLELGYRDGRERCVRAEAIGASGTVERSEDARVGQRERVRRAVERFHESETRAGKTPSARRRSRREDRR